MAIEVVNRQRLASIDRRKIVGVADATLAEVGRYGATVTIAFVRDRAIRRLNLDYRGKDRATDVLSFPNEGDSFDSTDSDFTDGDYLGDVVISTDTAIRQAQEAGHAFEREASELVIHGILHLCGYDHETDSGEMNRVELRIRRKALRKG
ncbi:MAG: rRNA maturation RNase YbeY [Blastocatellia bacterium]|nr:rRNA maturation RNase YbeY [Blastocatellia bacterium]